MFGSWFNFVTIGILAVALMVLPIWLIFFYVKHFSRFEDPTFDSQYGSVYEGLRKDSKWVLVFPVYFITRRILFMAVCFGLYRHVIMQLFAVICMCMVAAMIGLHLQPFEEPLMNKLEVMNECFTLLLIYFVFCFTDLLSDN